jgi:poly(3-hydroxybutyrate) depolymerase
LLARQHGLPIEDLGEVSEPSADGTPARLIIELHGSGATGSAEDRGSRVADELIVGLDELRHAWEGGLSRALGWEHR